MPAVAATRRTVGVPVQASFGHSCSFAWMTRSPHRARSPSPSTCTKNRPMSLSTTKRLMPAARSRLAAGGGEVAHGAFLRRLRR